MNRRKWINIYSKMRSFSKGFLFIWSNHIGQTYAKKLVWSFNTVDLLIMTGSARMKRDFMLKYWYMQCTSHQLLQHNYNFIQLCASQFYLLYEHLRHDKKVPVKFETFPIFFYSTQFIIACQIYFIIFCHDQSTQLSKNHEKLYLERTSESL